MNKAKMEMKKCRKKQSKNKGSILIWFMGLMGRRLPIYLIVIVISIIGIAGNRIAISYIIKTIVTAAQTKVTTNLYLKVLVMFLVSVGMMLLWRFGIIHYNIEGKKGIAKVEKLVFSKAMRLPMSYYENNHSGDFMSKLIFDTERAGDIYGSRFRRFTSAVLSAIVYLIPMFYYSWQLTTCLFLLSLISFFVNCIFTGPMKKMGTKLSEQNGVMTQKLTNILAGIELTKIFPSGQKLLNAYDVANDKCCETQKKTNQLSASLEGFGTLFDLTGALAFLGLGILFVSKGIVTLGGLTAIYAIYGSFQQEFLDIGKYLPQMMNCIANAEKVKQFLDMEEEPEQYETILNMEQMEQRESNSEIEDDIAVSMNHINFSYRSDREILKDFSMKIKKGSFVAVTGASGRGKSTLAKLLLGFYRPQSGEITVCNKSYRDITLKEARSMIGYVPQEPYLYGVTIAENIAYGRSDCDPEEVPMEDIIRAAKAANAHEFIMNLPDGYQTIPGERGNTLSGGEKQRIAIARAVLKNAPVLLLDEATSALDNESERLVNEALDRLCVNRTTIMIAHRASTIAMADTVIAL